MAIEELFLKQQELMVRVPHNVRPESLVKMQAGVLIIESLIKYLNSTGHKPWRPIPLAADVQTALLDKLHGDVRELEKLHVTNEGEGMDFSDMDGFARQLISAYGVMEETIEYVSSLQMNDPPAHKLEEITDMLFFYLEQVLMSGFTWKQIEAEYHRKHAVNLERYAKAEKNDYSWDKRKEGGL